MATKKDLVDRVAKKLGYLEAQDAQHAVELIFKFLKEQLAEGNRIEIRGFGSLSVRKRKYADKDSFYNSIYYRMSKNIQKSLNNNNIPQDVS